MSKPTLPFIDYAAVKAATNIKMVLEHYGLWEKLRPHGESSWRGCCPIHHGTDNTQFAVTPSKNLWRCFSQTGCVSGGNHLDLVTKLENCTAHEAAWKLNEWFNLGQEKVSKPREQPAKGERKAPPAMSSATLENQSSASPPRLAAKTQAEPIVETGTNKVLNFTLEHLDAAHPYLADRGLHPDTIAEFGIGYCAKGIMAGRIAIPIHSPAGELVANAGRWPGDPPEGKEKYRLPGGFKKSLELFNAHRAFAEPSDQPLVIVEGFFDVMQLWQEGFRRAVALMGWFLSPQQEEIISSRVNHNSRILLMLDADSAGEAARLQVASQLSRHCFVRSIPLPADGVTTEILELLSHH